MDHSQNNQKKSLQIVGTNNIKINTIHSGVSGVAMGQKTAYGFISGINGQALSTINNSTGTINANQIVSNIAKSQLKNIGSK